MEFIPFSRKPESQVTTIFEVTIHQYMKLLNPYLQPETEEDYFS